MKKYIVKIAVVLALTAFINSCKSKTDSKKDPKPKKEHKEGRPENGDRPIHGERPNIGEMFVKMDVDADAKLSKEEVKGPLVKDFDKIDANSDGFITKEELENAPKPERPERGERPKKVDKD